MKILILAGGTGSIAIQEGLYNLLDKVIDGVDTKILVNGCDNGLSTGAVRRVTNGKILGPSDVRKNQTTRLRLENPNSPWVAFQEIRFTVETAQAHSTCIAYIDELIGKLNNIDWPNTEEIEHSLKDAVYSYFALQNSLQIDYNDFSLANIIYAGLAIKNKNSLRKAANIMARFMHIRDNVILNDDTSLFLGAVSQSGARITDEGDIVSWGKADDPIVDVFFTDSIGKPKLPVLCDEAKDAIHAADLIILAPGTQWSSLIPTYKSVGFKEAIDASKAKIVMVMNRHPDHDCPGQTASDIIKVLVPEYFSANRIRLIVDPSAHKQMNSIDKYSAELLQSVQYSSMGSLQGTNSTKHHPNKVAEAIGEAYFDGFLDSEAFMFDYDDTLVGRGNQWMRSSQFNRSTIAQLASIANISICTGNSIKAITLPQFSNDLACSLARAKTLNVFADGGVNLYEYSLTRNTDDADDYQNAAEKISTIDQQCIIKNDGVNNIIQCLVDAGIPRSKIENRGNVVISIKPIDAEYRTMALTLVRSIIASTGLEAAATGRTTIDIRHPKVSKIQAVNYVMQSGVNTLTFVGDEFGSGNDAPVQQINNTGVKCLSVTGPAETAFFLKTLSHKLFRG